MSDFPKRVILGEGYPWAYGIDTFHQVGVNKSPIGDDGMELNWPMELWRKDVPQYRLVLERVDDDE